MKEMSEIPEELLQNQRSHILAQLFFNLRLISHIPILFYVNGKILGTETLNEIILPSEIEQPFLCDPTIADWLHKNAAGQPSIQKETSSIYYCTHKYADSATCILGPLSDGRLMKADLHAYIKRHHIHNYQNYFIHSASHQEAYALMSVIEYLIKGNLQSPFHTELPLQETEQKEDISQLSDYLLQNYRSNTEQHLPFLFEQQMLDFLRKGDFESFMRYTASQTASFSSYSLGKLSNNDLKQQEYLTVTLIALYSRAAIEGGVNPYDAFDISDMLLQKLSSKQTVEHYSKIQEECVRTFYSAVKKSHSIATSSIHIEKCKYYISKHLRTPFTIPDVAEYVGVSSNYLGNLFRKYESCTLKRYIILERIKAAKNMLKYSDFSISEISNSLCFQNQSYFGVTFKKETGMTPIQFRKVNKPQNF